MTDILGQTTFISLYQAGEGIFTLFNKVMVIDKVTRSILVLLPRLVPTLRALVSGPSPVKALLIT